MRLHKSIMLIGISLCVIGLSSCSKHLRQGFGEPNDNNMQAQQQFEDAPAENVEHTLNGRKAERVMINYRNEKAKTDKMQLVDDIN